MFGSYNRKDYLEPTLVDRAIGAAAWVGAAAIGYSALKNGTANKTLATFVRSLGSDLPEKFGVRYAKGSVDAAISTFSPAAQELVEGPHRVATSLVTQRIAHVRTNSWITSVRNQVDADSIDLFDSKVDDLRGLLFSPLTSTDVGEAKDKLLSSEWVDSFRKLTEGVKFQNNSRESISKIIAGASDNWKELSRETYQQVLTSEANQQTIFKSIQESVGKRRRQYDLFSFLKPDTAQELTFADLMSRTADGEVSLSYQGKAFNEFAEKHLGINPDKDGKGFVEQVYEKFERGVRDTLAASKDDNLSPSQTRLMEAYHDELMETQIGYMYHEGKLIPKARGLQTVGEKMQRALNETSIPLLPGVFQVQASRLLNFVKPDSQSIRNLGLAIAQPELKRAGFKFGSGVGLTKVGSSLLEFDPNTLELKKLEGKYTTIATFGSRAAKEMQRVRSEEPLTYLEEMYAVAQSDPTVLGKIKNAFAGDPNDWSKIQQMAFNNQHHWMTPHIDPDGRIVAVANPGVSKGGLDKFLLSQFKDPTNVEPSELNIDSLQHLLKTSVDDRPFLKTEISRQVIKQGANNTSNIMSFLVQEKDSLIKDNQNEVLAKIHQALGESNSASTLWDALQKNGLFDSEMSEALKEFPDLFEVLEKSKMDREGFIFPRQGGNRLVSNVLGFDAPSELHNKFQTAVLDQILEAQGKEYLTNRGIGEATLQNVLSYHQTGGKVGSDVQKFHDIIQKTFNLSSTDVDRFSKYLVSGLYSVDSKGVTSLDQKAFSNFSRIFSPLERPNNPEYNKLIGSRIAGAKSDSIFRLQTSILQDTVSTSSSGYNVASRLSGDSVYGRLAQLQQQMAESKTIIEGIKAGPERTPVLGNLVQTNATKYYAINYAVDLDDMMIDPKGSIQKIKDNFMGTVAGLTDNEKAFNLTSYTLTVLGQMSNQLGAEIGLGLSVQDKMSASRYLRAIALKRSLPLLVGVGFLNNVNAEADELGIPGLDDGVSQLRANISLSAASLSDQLGFTPIAKYLTQSIPGAETWFNPRSRKEYEEFLAYGSEAVREGQGWLIGNKGAFRGGAVDYYRPNYYRRGTSGWKSAANSIVDPSWSWIPTPLHPFAPVKKLLLPGKFVADHRYDRPYIENGLPDDFGTKYALNRVLYGGVNGGLNYDFVKSGFSEGDFGGGGVTGNEGGSGGFGNGEGMGGGPGGGQEVENPGAGIGSYLQQLVSTKQVTVGGYVSKYINRFREQGGLYGGIIKALPIWPQSNSVRLQAPGDALDPRRYLTGGGYGELLGPYGEYFRRVLGGRESGSGDYSPYRNNMPSWIKDQKYHTGDPYCVSFDTKIVTKRGLINAEDIVLGDQVKTHEGKYQPITDIIIRDVNSNESVFNLTLFGLPCLPSTASEEHPYYVLKDNKQVWVEAKDLQIGDYITYPKSEFELSNTIFDLAKSTKLKYTENSIVCCKSSDHFVEVLNAIESLNVPTKPENIKTYTFNRMIKRAKKEVIDRKYTKPRYIEVTNDLWYVIGWALAEASYQQGCVRFSMHIKEESYALEIVKILSQTFGDFNYTWERLGSSNGAELRIYSTIIKDFLQYCTGKGAFNKKINVNLQITKENFENCLKGYFEGDGCHFTSQNRTVVSAKSVSLELIYQLWEKCLALNLVGSIIKNPKYRTSSESYTLKFSSEMAVKFAKFILKLDLKKVKPNPYSNYIIFEDFVAIKLKKKSNNPNITQVYGFTVNSASTFCVPGAITHNTKFKGLGELVLPGEALERVAPWIHPMKARGSMLGDSEDEIVKKMLDPIGESTDSPYTRYGSFAHLAVQNKLKERGILLAAEVPLYDAEHNISGTMDAVVNGSTGREVIDIKTQNAKDYQKGLVDEKYMDQLNFYLVTTGAKRGHLAFVNSDDPSQVRFFTMNVDEDRYTETLNRLERARQKIRGLIDEHIISPYETYDALARLTVLSKISPHSKDIDELFSYFEGGGGGLNSQEKVIYNQIKKETLEARKQYRTISYRNTGTRMVSSKILAINPDGTITTEAGNIRMAGLEFDRQAFIKEDPEEIYKKFGLNVGGLAVFNVSEALADETMQNTTVSGIFGSVNQKLIEQGYASKLNTSDDPVDHHVMSGVKGAFRTGVEWLLHRDFYVLNKLWRVRSPVEQLERGEAFGTDSFRWNDIGKTLVMPTITSLISKDPITAGLTAGLTAQALVSSKSLKGNAFKVAGAIAAGASLIRSGWDILGGILGDDSVWTAPRYRKQQEIDEYYDALQYIKSYSQAETIRQKALEKGHDLDNFPDLAPTQIRNLYYKAVEKAQSTMYAYDVVKGTLDEALAAIPYRHQQLAKEVILHGKQSEKDRFYKLLSSPEKRVLGRFLGHREAAAHHYRKPLEQLFRGRFNLPNADWRGWDSDVDLDVLSKATSVAEGTLAAGLSAEDRSMLSADPSISVPKYKQTNIQNVSEVLRSIQNKVDVPVLIDLKTTPSGTNNVNLNVDIRTTSRNSDLRAIERDLKRV